MKGVQYLRCLSMVPETREWRKGMEAASPSYDVFGDHHEALRGHPTTSEEQQEGEQTTLRPLRGLRGTRRERRHPLIGGGQRVTYSVEVSNYLSVIRDKREVLCVCVCKFM